MQRTNPLFHWRKRIRSAASAGTLFFLVQLTACSPDAENAPQHPAKHEPAQDVDRQLAPPRPSSAVASTSGITSDLTRGEQIWNENCFTCHGTGRAGAPKIGEKSLWAPRIAQGLNVLVDHALNGLQGKGGSEMPPKGGNPALSDTDVTAAVAYMVTQSR